MKKEMTAIFNEKEFPLWKKLKEYQEASGVSESDFIKTCVLLGIPQICDDGEINPKTFGRGIKAIKNSNSLWGFAGIKIGIDNHMLDFLSHAYIEIKKEEKT